MRITDPIVLKERKKLRKLDPCSALPFKRCENELCHRLR